MPDTADKSDDLIAELAKLMASGSQGSDAAVKPVARPAPFGTAPTPSATPSPIRIPGMDAPVPPTEVRAPATGSIRIPGMDQPAPVTTTAPVSKFDFGKPPAPPQINQEPLSSIADRIAARTLNADPVPYAPPTVSAPAPNSFVPPPIPRETPPEPSIGSGFDFDFGFKDNPPQAPTPANDPIADLIAAELDEPTLSPALPPRDTRSASAVVTPMVRVPAAQQQSVPNKPTLTPMAAAVAARPANAAPVPLKPVSVTPRSSESDRFAISPGMGLNRNPPPNQPLSPPPTARVPQPVIHDEPEYSEFDSDPMSEIESLIGEAVRVELSPGPVRVQAAAMPETKAEPHFEPAPPPVVPPLTTQYPPRRSDLKDVDHSDAAEDAILAAVGASGADIGRLDGPADAESPYRRLKVKPERRSFLSGGMRQYVGMAVAGTLLLAAGFGLYWVLNMGRGDPATARVLTADPTQVKVAPPANANAATEAATSSPVLRQIDGVSAAPSEEQLVSTDETSTQDVTRVVPEANQATTAGSTEGGLANRKVRTVTVRPDGTIVSGDDAVAGAEELPVDRPNVPDLPVDSTSILNTTDTADATSTAPDPLASTINTAAATTAETAVADLGVPSGGVIDPNKVSPTPAPAPDRAAMAFNAPAQSSSPVTAVVDAAPSDQGVDLLASNDTPAPAAAAPAPAASADAGAYVQLTSSPSQDDATAQARSQMNRYGSLFEGNSLIVRSADLGQRGTWYRVLLPVNSLTDANRICASIKANGGDCITKAN